MLIKPFKALRPKSTVIERIMSPPYQSLSEEEFENKDRDVTDLYALAIENLATFIESDRLKKSEKLAYYVYRLSYMDDLIYGLVMSVSREEIESDKLPNSENTNYHAKLIDTHDAFAYPVALTYPNLPTFRKDFKEFRMKKLPVYLFDAPDDYNHCIWMLDDPEGVEAITKHFAEDVAHFTVHNRSEVLATASDSFLAIAFPEPLTQEPNIFDGLFVLQRETKVE